MRLAAALCLSLPAVLLAGEALARCPTSDDISAGIVYSNTVAGQESINVAFGTTAYLASYYELVQAFQLTYHILLITLLKSYFD